MNNLKNYLNYLKIGIDKLDLLKLQKIENIIFKKIRENKKYLYVVMGVLRQLQIIFYVILIKELN
tara:strand:- start:4707 stop:4901 length:195 start_codon:yes stop_codon:yes gene_type:complete